MNQKESDINDDYKNVETRTNELINPNKIVINNILHFLTLEIITFAENCKEFRYYNVQYNNAILITSQQIIINYSIILFTCKV